MTDDQLDSAQAAQLLLLRAEHAHDLVMWEMLTEHQYRQVVAYRQSRPRNAVEMANLRALEPIAARMWIASL